MSTTYDAYDMVERRAPGQSDEARANYLRRLLDGVGPHPEWFDHEVGVEVPPDWYQDAAGELRSLEAMNS